MGGLKKLPQLLDLLLLESLAHRVPLKMLPWILLALKLMVQLL